MGPNNKIIVEVIGHANADDRELLGGSWKNFKILDPQIAGNALKLSILLSLVMLFCNILKILPFHQADLSTCSFLGGACAPHTPTTNRPVGTVLSNFRLTNLQLKARLTIDTNSLLSLQYLAFEKSILVAFSN